MSSGKVCRILCNKSKPCKIDALQKLLIKDFILPLNGGWSQIKPSPKLTVTSLAGIDEAMRFLFDDHDFMLGLPSPVSESVTSMALGIKCSNS